MWSWVSCKRAVPLTLLLTDRTGEIKKELITVLTDLVSRHQRARIQVTDDVVDAFMAVRLMPCV